MKKAILTALTLIALSFGTPHFAAGQEGASGIAASGPTYWSPVIMGAPSLAILPDARSTGMGNIGLTTDADAYGLYHNMSKMGFLTNRWGLSATYTPWMASYGIKGMSFSYLTGYYSFEDEYYEARHSLAASLRYFRVGEALAFTTGTHTPVTVHPYELALDLGYALRFNPRWSFGAAIRYAISDFNTISNGVAGKAATVLGDLSVTYRRPVTISKYDGLVSAALALNNIGGKLTHDGGKSYLFSPAIMRLGVGLETEFTALHKLGVHLEASKFLAPTFPGNGTEDELSAYYNMNVFEGLFGSFGDAKGGSLEELKEVSWGLGLEYVYADRLFARAGYFIQDPSKGSGGGLTLGAGVKYEWAKVDLSYLAATRPDSPLNNTLRIGVTFDF